MHEPSFLHHGHIFVIFSLRQYSRCFAYLWNFNTWIEASVTWKYTWRHRKTNALFITCRNILLKDVWALWKLSFTNDDFLNVLWIYVIEYEWHNIRLFPSFISMCYHVSYMHCITKSISRGVPKNGVSHLSRMEVLRKFLLVWSFKPFAEHLLW